MELGDITYQISQMLRISPSILKFPGVITNLLIPLIFFTYLLKRFLLENIFKQFPSWTLWVISCVASFLTLMWISAFGYFIAIGSILYFCHKKISDYIKGTKGMILGIIVGVIGIILYMSIPAIIDFIMSFIRGY